MKEWADAGETDFGLPELDPQEYMVWFLFDLGPTRSNGMTEAPTDWDILLPYATAKALDSEDTAILSDMCKGYHAARAAGVNPLAIAPVDQQGDQHD
ncbi:hypothetical protein [Pseudosulfitobacter pseudonitzschiae]|uniref:hypothetical protein n=1 Tax=Pseudosulfitobacter pseudonitzschiae TaxID=1402135 RepID=UPI001AF65BAE|nr:hypothetical protein [Pseudosulfitobacter pseudonitzschiae]MBM1834172.1 hypothetical protein [Pseudosulfitobacter pseudonitzschiae]MBM1839037.1 hypothetical protein [Pseudosulfitobacter pseudonitzschiae]MBM1843887.1 hypothetical protein [Pseudosulfitobacter pseudonitzschiae]MBM1848732.1 hypothetical protein [Pseudosulfitobacter pseudonitzschiae]MBM1853594.1 hypothetical protein [Pseudosulfitobacter pseudonitzschiae]